MNLMVERCFGGGGAAVGDNEGVFKKRGKNYSVRIFPSFILHYSFVLSTTSSLNFLLIIVSIASLVYRIREIA